ncbi:MAG: RHS repeat-associated core domain-containing protein, partial [Myxococcales bacterium]|nr:RHS repeat-associated core domain-containing protein [Myxococcales bacterium]
AVEDGVTALYGRTTAPAPGAPDEHLVETVTLDQVATTRAYDRLGRLVDVQRGGESWQLAWQPTGMLHSITRGGLVETRTYQPNALQRLATLTVADAGGGATHYDASYVWRLGSVDDPLPEGDPTQPAATLSVTTGDGVTDYWFDQQWRLEQVVYPEADGERRLHHYTLAGDGTRLMETVWRTWDDAGNPAIEQVERFRHEYDAAGRLDAVRRDVWAADAWVEDSPGLDADDNPLPRLDVAFDPLGRMRTWVEDGQTRTFTWDAESRMVQATLGAGAPGGGETWNYAYNWRDQRTLRVGGAQGAEWAYAYRWGADGLLTEQVTAPGGAVTDRAFVQGAGLTLGVVSGAGVTAFGHDHLGSPVVTRAPGGAVDTRRFGARGALASGDAPAHGEVQVGYTGHGFDPESGLVYAQARYYATGLGVFLSEDPYEGSLGEPLSLGRWGYVHGNPVELVDPDGRIGTPAQRAEEWDREDTPKSEVFLGFLRSSCDGNLHCAEHLWRLNREVNLSHSEAAEQGSQFLQRNREKCEDEHCTVLMKAYRRVPGQMEAGVVGAVVAGANIDREVQTI